MITASLLTLISTFWREDLGHQTTDEYDIPVPAVNQSKNNSTFLSQSGLLAGSMIIQADEKINSLSVPSLNTKQGQRRLIKDSGRGDSEQSLSRTVKLRHLRTQQEDRTSQYSLFRDPENVTEDGEYTVSNQHICKEGD